MNTVRISLFILCAILGQVDSWYLLKKDVTSSCTREGRKAKADGLHACLAALNEAAQNLHTPLIARSRRLSVYVDVIFDATPTIFNVCCESHASGGRVVTINPLDTESRTDALETRDVPFINLEKIGGDSEEVFTLMLVKSSYNDRYLGVPDKPLILWMVTDIQRDTITNGHVKIPYMGPTCAEQDNTYMFLLYRQTGPAPADAQAYADPGACPEMDTNAFRCQFDVNAFTRDGGMQLVGANWFHCVYSTYTVYRLIHDMNIPEVDACENSPLSSGNNVDGQLVCAPGSEGMSDFFKNSLRFGNIPKRAPPSEDSQNPPKGKLIGIPKTISDFLSYIFDLNAEYTPESSEQQNDISELIPFQNDSNTGLVDEAPSNDGGFDTMGSDIEIGNNYSNSPSDSERIAQTSVQDIQNETLEEPIDAPITDEVPVGTVIGKGGEDPMSLENLNPLLRKSPTTGEVLAVLRDLPVSEGTASAEDSPSDAVARLFDEPLANELPVAGETIATGGEKLRGAESPLGTFGAVASAVDDPMPKGFSDVGNPIAVGGADIPQGLPSVEKAVASGRVFDGPIDELLSSRIALPTGDSKAIGAEIIPNVVKEIPESTQLLFKSENSADDAYTQNTPGTTTPDVRYELPRSIDLNPPREPPRPDNEPQIDPLAIEKPIHPMPPGVPFLDDGLPPPDDPPRFSNSLVGDTGIADDDRMIDLKGLFDQLLRQSNAKPVVEERPVVQSPLARLLMPRPQLARSAPSYPFRSRLSDYFRVMGFPFEERTPVELPFFEEQRDLPTVYSKLSISHFPGYTNVIQSMETDDGVQSVSYVESPSMNNDEEIVSKVLGTVQDGIFQGDVPEEPEPIPQGLFPNPLSIDLSDQIVKARNSVPMESTFERFMNALNNGRTGVVIDVPSE